MTTGGNDFFSEIEAYHFSQLSLKEKYARYYSLLDRACKQITKESGIDYSNLFSRLHAVCREKLYLPQNIERFRIHCKLLQRGEFVPDDEDYLIDLKALCEAVAHFFSCEIPITLQKLLPQQQIPQKTICYSQNTFVKRIRLVVTSWNDKQIEGYCDKYPTEQPLTVDYSNLPVYNDLSSLLYEGAQLNVLSAFQTTDRRIIPEQLVLEPDYLIDITSLSECFQSYGASPYTYLLNKLKPSHTNKYKLLGNAANQFLDDCVNETQQKPADYKKTLATFFKDYCLELSVCDDIGKEFFDETQQQFLNIRKVVQKHFTLTNADNVILEPSFCCECLGLQGRMDFLQRDYQSLVELKSGKMDEYHNCSKESHALQMALYKEILYYNLDVPRDKVRSFLLYSKYPHFIEEQSSKQQIQHALQLRNRIVSLELSLKNGSIRTVLERLTPTALNINKDFGMLWSKYQEPELKRVLAPLQQNSRLALCYYYNFLAFISREQHLDKTGDSRYDSCRGFSDLWNAETDAKLASGSILLNLIIVNLIGNEGIEKIEFRLSETSNNYLPNFRKSDIVLLYERNTAADNACNKQIIRGSIEEICSDRLLISLRNKQRNEQIFNKSASYAMEHDLMDSSYRTIYQGLYGFLVTQPERKALLLNEREAQEDLTQVLSNDYPNKQIGEIVLRAKQAKDYFLLVGPPGTGKTSIALRCMVEEFYSNTQNNILLLSYTNRAVDEICETLDLMNEHPSYVRIGSELACDAKFTPRLLKNVIAHCQTRTQLRETLEEQRIFVGTVFSISGKQELFQLKHFQVAIFDEASQIMEPQIIGLLSALDYSGKCAIEKFILIGDNKQLPAVVLQNENETTVTDEELKKIGITNYSHSLFERLYHLQQTENNSKFVSSLQLQGRMHPDVATFANRHFYNGKLLPVPVKHQTEPLPYKTYDANDFYECLVATHRTAFLPSARPNIEESNKTNRNEAIIVGEIANAVYTLCVKNHIPFTPAQQIGIIVPFRNQIALIYKEMRRLSIPDCSLITVDTVERFQGSQRDIIIFSTTISMPYQLDILSAPIYEGKKAIDRKLNVAVTRARKQLFVTGNVELLAQSELYKALMQEMKI